MTIYTDTVKAQSEPPQTVLPGQTGLPAAMGYIDAQLNALDAIVDDLALTLQPFLRESQLPDLVSGELAQGDAAPATLRLQQLGAGLGYQVARIQDILDRVDR